MFWPPHLENNFQTQSAIQRQHWRAGEEGSKDPSRQCLVVNEGRMRTGHWLSQYNVFSSVLNTASWVTVKTSGLFMPLSPKVLFW